MKKIFGALISFLIVVSFAESVCSAGQFDRIISASEVEKITGLTGIKQVPRDPKDKFRNGDLNFVGKHDEPLVMLQFRPSFVVDAMKSDSGYFKASLQGIGDEAFSSPAFDPQFSVNFVKGNYLAVVTTDIDPKDKKKTVLTMDQLVSIAKLVASRM
jgi:hypothetical protein